ncbi:uncharacterized protein LOC116347696 [Contarinia nasturtii]|uniref:uncharacterized protein LOC116347696 n=1 Tax=Contarinia nasturtii TaxID=265458 RepID=UPI0012D37636|nr:uncharacterized protein LOC116347696 [Contarinia nasturtii]
MKLLLIVAFIYVYFEYVSLEHKQEEMKLDEQIQNLQTDVKCIRQYLKEMYLKSLPENGRSIKEIYLSSKAKDTLNAKRYISYEDFVLARAFKRNMSTGDIMGLSSQVVEDYVYIFKLFDDNATRRITSFLFSKLRSWNTRNIVLNVTYVEQKMNETQIERGQLPYSFDRDEYNECLELFAEDLSKKVASDTISRVMTLQRILYGNRTEIENALSYLYGSASAIDSTTNATS